MEKEKNTREHTRGTTWKLITIFISLLILYTLYHVIFGLSESVPTTSAGIVEYKISEAFEGVVFRDENVVSTNYNGTFRPYLENGEKATVGSVVAVIYSERADVDLISQITKLEEKLDILKRSNSIGVVSIVDIEKLHSEIDGLYATLMRALSENDIHKIKKIEKELLILLNKKKIYEGEIQNYKNEIEQVKSELDRLYESFKGDKEYIYAEHGGYFYHKCDGYEQILSIDILTSLGAENLLELMDKVKNEPIVKNNFKGKFVYTHEWKIATVSDEDTASRFVLGQDYSVTIFDVRERKLDAILESVSIQENGRSVLVFSFSSMPLDFDYSRYQSFKIDMLSLEGYRVPKDAIVKLKDEKNGEEKTGVYVLDSSIVYFKQVDIIAEESAYFVVSKTDKSQADNLKYLDINDIIILSPEKVYDGKILKK